MPADNAHTDASSNSDAAQTVAQTVMAEQVGDNVVIDSVSASASAPADVAANPITTDSAESGKRTIDDVTQKEVGTDTTAAAISENATAVHGNGAASSAESASRGEGQIEDGGPSVPVAVEGSKAEADLIEQKKDEGHHVRTNSVKKPTTFSKISATKNFLAKAASPAPTPAAAPPKLGDKPSPAAAPAQPAAAKPRLIAKSASTLQSIQRPRPGAEGAGAPDASKVWNKNRRRFIVSRSIREIY